MSVARTLKGPIGDVRLALIVCAGYFAGTLVGLELRLPPATPSVLWPPNSILTTALLFTPLSRWWVVIAAALPAHLYLQTGVFPPPLVLALFVTNCSEALLAAGIIRRFNDQPTRFDSLYRVAVFITAAGVISPVVSSFLDAAVVVQFTSESYWDVWKVRLWSNVLAALAVIPATASLIQAGWKGLLAWPRRRWLESSAIAGLIVLALLGSTELATVTGLVGLQGAALLPLLLWTAVRFGPAGAGISLLTSVLILVSAAVAGRGPLDAIPTAYRVAIVQTFLIATAIPSMCVAALIEERRQAEIALRSSDATKSAILASLPSHVAVLDSDGRVIAANGDWRSFAADMGLLSSDERDALRIDLQSTDRESAPAPQWREALRAVLDKRRSEFTVEYAPRSSPSDRWYSMSLVPLKRPEGGAVMTHTDVTERRRAELNAQQSREELAHVGRVWVLGELTAALSHQVNQPLTAIVGNANAGRRFIDSGKATASELASVFDDIASDAGRASEVIKSVRDLLRKNTNERETVDLNELTSRTAQLVHGESLMREVRVCLELTPGLPAIQGNRVQLQQVLLNLVVNAMESAGGTHGDRLVLVTTAFHPRTGLRVSVQDTGHGLPEGSETLVFEPFFTTKPGGMGMGLAIARAIVEAHGGSVEAQDTGSGALLTVTLPHVEFELG